MLKTLSGSGVASFLSSFLIYHIVPYYGSTCFLMKELRHRRNGAPINRPLDQLLRYATLENMVENNNKPLTIKDIRGVLLPAMQEVFLTKKGLERCLARQERRLRTLMIDALREHGLLPPHALEEIDEIEISQ